MGHYLQMDHQLNLALFWMLFLCCSETLELYSMNIKKLCQQLLRYIASSLGLKAETFNNMFGKVVQAWRMNYYPPCSRPDLVLGMTPHSDGSAITVLQQNTSSVGLQILKDHTWVPVQPIANALVINIGDTIEVRHVSHKLILLSSLSPSSPLPPSL